MSTTEINYITSVDDGPSLITTTNDYGWIEYAKKYYKIYASKSFPADLYQERRRSIISAGITPNIGFVAHLVDVLENNNFLFPAFGILENNSFQITCGGSRLHAHICSGQELSTYGLVVFSREPVQREEFTEIHSSKEFEDFFNLGSIEYRIKMNYRDHGLEVASSILRHTFYEDDVLEVSHIHRSEKEVRKFWKKFTDEETQLIKIAIHCLPEHQQFVNPSKLFKVKFIDVEPLSWNFSFAKLLGEFNTKKPGNSVWADEIKMWLFNPTEPFDLEMFLPLMQSSKSCVYTRNQKAVLFDASSYSDFRICGNIVK